MMGIYILFLSFSSILPNLVFSFLNYPTEPAIVCIYSLVGAYVVFDLREPVIIIDDKFSLPNFKTADELFFDFRNFKKNNCFFASDFQDYFDLKQKCEEFKTRNEAYRDTSDNLFFKFIPIYLLALGLFIKNFCNNFKFLDYIIFFAVCIGFVILFCFLSTVAFKKFHTELYTVYYIENCSCIDENAADPKDYFSEDGKISYFKKYVDYEYSRCYDRICQRIICLREASIYISEIQSKEVYLCCFLPVIAACLLRLL